MKRFFKLFVAAMLVTALLLANMAAVGVTAEYGEMQVITIETSDLMTKFSVPEEFKADDVENEESFTYRSLDALDVQHTINWSNVVYLEGYSDTTENSGIFTFINELEATDEGYDLSRINEEYPEKPEKPVNNVDMEVLSEKMIEAALKAICADKDIALPENYAEMTGHELAEALGFESEEELIAALNEYTNNETFVDIPEYQEYKKYQKALTEYTTLYEAYRAKCDELRIIKNYAFENFSEIANVCSDEEWKTFFENELNKDTEIRYENIEILSYGDLKVIHATVYAEDSDDEIGVYEYYQFNDTKTIVRIIGGVLFGSEPHQTISDALAGMTIEANDELGVPEIKSATVLEDSPFEVLVVLGGKNNGGVVAATLMDNGAVAQTITMPADTYLRFNFDENLAGGFVKAIWLEDMSSLKPMCESVEGYVYPTGDGYAYLLSIDDDLSFNVFTQNGDYVKLFAAKEVVIDGVSYNKNDEEILNILKKSAEEANANYPDEVNAEYSQPIKYSLGVAGKLTINTVFSPSDSTISTMMDDGSHYIAYDYRRYSSSSKSFGYDFKVSSSTRVIFVPDDRSDTDGYETFGYSNAFFNSVSYHVEAYGLSETKVASLVLLYKENPSNIYTSSSPWMIVDSVTLNTSTDETIIKGYTGTSYTLRSITVSDKVESVSSIGKGDLIRFLTDQSGKMSDYKVWFDASNPSQIASGEALDEVIANRILEIKATGTEPVTNYPAATFRLQYGTVTDILLDDGTGAVDEETITVSPTIKEDNMDMVLEGNGVVAREIGVSVKVFSFDRSDENAEVITGAELSDLCAYNTCGEYASRVITYSSSGILRTIYIINDGPYVEHEEIEIPTEDETEEPTTEDNVIEDGIDDGWKPPAGEGNAPDIGDGSDADEPEIPTNAPTEEESETDWEEPSEDELATE